MPKPDDSVLPQTQVTPDPVLEKRSHRRFTTEYKLRIIAEVDQCQHGELGASFRRERLYVSGEVLAKLNNRVGFLAKSH